MITIKYISNSADETFTIAQRFADMLTANEKILLYGELGSGKTLFIKGLAAGFGMLNYNEVSSPSFVLIKEYHIKTVILYHVDLYRIADNDEYFYKDIDELIRSDDLVAIEWAEKLKETAFPHIKIHLEYLNETSRLITITQLH